jgi:Mlc titration factor MtfA (ptsG expression regulator)
VIEEAVASAAAVPAEPPDASGLLEEQAVVASATAATTPADFIAVVRFTEVFLSLVPAQQCAQGVG